LELIERLTKQEHQDLPVFQLLQTFLAGLASQQKQKIERFLFATVWFDIQLLGALGHAPKLASPEMELHRDEWLLLQPDGLHQKNEKPSYRQQRITLEDRALLRFAQQKGIADIFQVAVSPAQASRQLQCARIFLEEYDTLPLASDSMVATFQNRGVTSVS
jgi:recombinational DNA repair protein (RecF pathway)